MGTTKPALVERMKSKRLIVITAAAGAVLVAGGTAGAAAVGDLGGGPDSAANNVAAGPPEAQTAEPAAPSASKSADPAADKEALKRRDTAAEQASQDFDAETAESKKKPAEPKKSDDGGDESGDSGGDAGLSPSGESGSCEASMYSEPQPTASGETFDPSAMTAAHKTLPMDTMVKVTNPDNGKSVTVRINDRGPYIAGRCLDLSTASFETIASSSQGVVNVDYQVMS